MQVFRRTAGGMVKGVAISVLSSAAVGFIVYMFMASLVVPVIVCLAMMAILLYITIFKDDIKIEIDGGQLRYFQRGACKESIALHNHVARYQIKTRDGSVESINLYFAPDAGGGNEICLDCEPLGRRQFDALWAVLERQGQMAGPERLETKKPD